MIQLWDSEEDKKVQVVALTNSPYRFSPTMAEVPEVPQTFYATLSQQMTVQALAAVVLEHSHANQLGHVGHFQPTDYQVHRIYVIKQYLLVQHEALVAEIHHIPPGGENAEPAFFVRIDQNIDTGISTIFRKLSIDRTTCSHERQPSFYATLWELDPGNDLNLLRLAVLLRFVSNLAGRYSIKRHNCFWFACVVREILQDHALFPNHQVDIPTASWPLYRLGACLGVRLGIPTANEIQWVRNRYIAYFAQIGNPVI